MAKEVLFLSAVFAVLLFFTPVTLGSSAWCHSNVRLAEMYEEDDCGEYPRISFVYFNGMNEAESPSGVMSTRGLIGTRSIRRGYAI